MLAVAGLIAVILSGCSGSVDSRLVGKWQNRSDLFSNTEVVFRSDGTATVTSSDGGAAKSYKCNWSVVNNSGKTLTINLKPSGQSAMQRKVVFKGSDLMEMSGPGGGYRRYQRVAAK